jgi:hypothetical protein
MYSLKISILPLLALVIVSPGWAQSKSKATRPGTASVAGMQVAIDPQTGRLRQPTPEERQALARALGRSLNRSTEGLTVTRFSNGMQKVDLQGRFQSISVATVDAHGKLQHRCITSPAEAKALASGAAAQRTSTAEVK